jgi:hypothetical protein
MPRARWRQARRGAAGSLLLALLTLAPGLLTASAPASASTIRVEYEDAFEEVQATETTAVEVKAAFLLRFPDFVRWQESPGDTLRIGVSGDHALFEMLKRLAEQENQAGFAAPHLLAVVEINSRADARHCEILVLGNGVAQDSLASLMKLSKTGTLTVGVWDEPRGGAVIRLFRDGNRVNFDISQSLAKEAGLQISSKLLNLAREQSSRVARNMNEPSRG